MIHKVQSNLPASYTNDVKHIEGKPDPSQEKGREIGGTSAEVSLSGDALALQRISQAVQNAPDVRDDIVQTIRDQLAAGTYKVDVEALAERLLSSLR